MRNSEYKEKYPTGTKIKYVGNFWDGTGDRGKVGTIVGFYHNYPLIFLPKSKHVSEYSTPDIPVSWEAGWKSIEILTQKNEQLLFSFME